MTTLLNAPVAPTRKTRWSARSSQSDNLPESSGRRNWLLRHDGVLAFLVYLAVSLVFYRTVLAHLNANCACGVNQDPGDNSAFVWWFEWFVHALGNGLPLMHPTVIWAPTGINMAETTASLLLALVASPLTLIAGPIVSYNAVMILAPVISGWGANRLCREVSGNARAALIAGATYGFSTYEIAHLVGHPQMVVTVCPPLAVLCVLRLLRGTISTRKFLIQFSLVLIAQILLSTEVMFTGVIAGALALGISWATGALPHNRDTTRKLLMVASGLAIAGVVCSYYEYLVLTAPAYSANAGGDFPTDLLSFIVPMPYTWLGGARFQSVSQHFMGGRFETNAYLGLPLILIGGRYAFTTWRSRSTKMLTILTAVLCVWILGPKLWIDGKSTIWLPYALFQHLPLLRQALQGRIALFLSLVFSVVLAQWLARPHRDTRLAWIAGIIALIAVIPNVAHAGGQNVDTWSNPKFFSSSIYKNYIRRGDSILPMIWGPTGEAMMWQAEDHMYWSMADGDWVYSPIAGWQNKLTHDLWANDPRPGDGRRLKAMIIKRHISEVVLQDQSTTPYPANRWLKVVNGAGLKSTAAVGGVTVYRVPSAWLTHRAG
jgi:hypothetical protein